MRTVLVAVAAALALVAQSSAPAIAQNGVLPSAASFVEAPALRSVTVSPNGRYVAYIRDTPEAQVL